MLINRGLINDRIEMVERIAIEAFASGWAGTQHYDQIADMRDCLMLAAAHKKDQSALAMCQGVRVVMDNIRTRYAEKSQFGVTGDELQLLRHFVDIYRDFWLRQPVHLYEAAVDALDKMRHAMNKVDEFIVNGTGRNETPVGLLANERKTA